MSQFDSSISHINEEDLNQLFEDVPAGTPGAGDLVGGRKPEDDIKKVKDDEKVIVKNPTEFGNIEQIDMEELEEEEETDDKKKKTTKKKAEDKVEDVEEDDEEDEEDKKSDLKEKDKKKSAKKEEDVEPSEEEKQSIKEALKNTVNYLVEKGMWLDFEGREDLEIDDETYAELAVKQDEARVSKMFSELVDSTGPYGKAIIGFIKQGGDPEAVIDIFKESKQIENLDTSGEEGQKQLVSKYYKEVLKWKPERIQKHISTLVTNEELESETENIKDLYDEYHKEELKQIAEEQRAFQEKQKEREEKFRDNIVSAIKERKDLSDKERRSLEKSILQYSHKLPDGNEVSDFYVKFSQLQSDPKEYIDLVRFVMNKEEYIKKLKTEINNKVTDKTFNFVKGNKALNKAPSTVEDRIRRESTIGEFSFFGKGN